MAETATSRKRLKTGAACESCRKRKSRCDARRPRCSNCRIRDVICEYGSPATRPPRPSYSRGPSSSAWTPATPLQGRADQIRAEDGDPSYLGSSTSFALISECNEYGPIRATAAPPAAQQHPAVTTASPESCYELPDRSLADGLVTTYFRRVHALYPFLHEGDFRAVYESVWQDSDDTLCSARLSRYALLNIVFAHGSKVQDVPPREVIRFSASYFAKRSRDLVLSYHGLQSGTLEMVQTMLLLCYHFLGTVELEECWNLSGLMMRMATGLGLHLSINSSRYTPIEKELRKRAGWGLLVLDRSLAMKFGRPLTIRIEDIHTDLPLEVDDQYLTNEVDVATQPSAIPSVISFFVSAIQLTPVIRDMLEQLYFRDHIKQRSTTDGILEPAYSRCHYILSQVVLIEGKLQSWWRHAPAHLTQETWGKRSPWPGFSIQRLVQKVKFLHIRLLLHRSTLLYFARHDINDQFLQSIASSSAHACLECAHQMIDLIRTHLNQHQDMSMSYGAQLSTYVFTSLCTLHFVEKMDGSKKIVVEGSESLRNRKDDYNAGLQILTAASGSSHLARRYARVIRQLNGARGREATSRPQSDAAVMEAESSRPWISNAPLDTQAIVATPSSGARNLSSGDQFDFGELGDILFSAGLLDPENTGSEVTDLFLEWP